MEVINGVTRGFAVVTQTDVWVIAMQSFRGSNKPGEDPVVFGYITPAKAEELVTKYLLGNEMLDGVIPVNYGKVDQ